MKKTILFCLFMLATIPWLATGYLYFLEKNTCHNQCAHGDKRCQDRCFKKGYCPQEDR
jgi:hypothetical protein